MALLLRFSTFVVSLRTQLDFPISEGDADYSGSGHVVADMPPLASSAQRRMAAAALRLQAKVHARRCLVLIKDIKHTHDSWEQASRAVRETKRWLRLALCCPAHEEPDVCAKVAQGGDCGC